MLRKLIAAASALALALGLAAVTAAPASAHTATLRADVACADDGAFAITWTVSNDHGTDATIWVSGRSAIPTGATIPARSSVDFVESVDDPLTTGNVTVTLRWASDDFRHTSNKVKVKKSEFPADCAPERDATASVEVAPASCEAAGEASFSIRKATWDGPASSTPGTHTRTATADPGHAFADGSTTATVEYTIEGRLDPGSAECLVPEPEWVRAACTGTENGPASYTLAGAAGVSYRVRVNLTGGWQDAAADVAHQVGAASYVQVRAFRGGERIAEWSHLFVPRLCAVKVTPVEPEIAQAACTQTPGEVSPAGYTLTGVVGVKYYVAVDGGPLALGEPDVFQPLAPGETLRVLAIGDIANGYYIGAVDLNERLFGPYTMADPDCDVEPPELPTLGIVTPTVVATQASCDAPGSYALGNEEGEPDAILWSVDGGPAFATGGTFEVEGAGSVVVTATPADGAGFAGEEPLPRSWTLGFEEPEACGQLDTLALTGGAAAGPLGLAAALLLVGSLVLAARRRESAES